MLSAIEPGGGFSARLSRMLFRLAALANYASYAPIGRAPSSTLIGRMADERPEISAFLRAPYLCAAWSADERLRRFTRHVSSLEDLPPLDFAVGQSINLMPLTAVSELLHVVIDKPMWFYREGVLALNLFEGNTRLFSLVFALEPTAMGLRAFIGGIQGRSLPDILDRYRLLTKQAHGIRPRDLIVELFRMVCKQLNVTDIHAVSDQERHNRHRYFGGDPVRALALNYDEIWKDRGGTAIDRRFFDLPLRTDRRTESDISAKKRSMYRQRYEMLDKIDLQMNSAWGQMTPVTRPNAL